LSRKRIAERLAEKGIFAPPWEPGTRSLSSKNEAAPAMTGAASLEL
jgi:hypothetical protein